MTIVDSSFAHTSNLNRLWYETQALCDPWYAVRYARYIVLGRWARGEPVIVGDHAAAYTYARDVVRGRFLLYECRLHQPQHHDCFTAGYLIGYVQMLQSLYPEAWHEYGLEYGDWLPA